MFGLQLIERGIQKSDAEGAKRVLRSMPEWEIVEVAQLISQLRLDPKDMALKNVPESIWVVASGEVVTYIEEKKPMVEGNVLIRSRLHHKIMVSNQKQKRAYKRLGNSI